MFEVLLPLYTLLILLCVFVWISHTSLKDAIIQASTQIESRLNGEVKIPTDFIVDLKEEVFDVVQETVESMKLPTAADHLLGAVGQFVQMKMMRQFEIPVPAIVNEENV